MEALLQLSGVSKQYGKGSQLFHAVSDAAFSIYPGETFGLIGESGSGKSTLGKMVTGLEYPTSGSLLYQGSPLWNGKNSTEGSLARCRSSFRTRSPLSIRG